MIPFGLSSLMTLSLPIGRRATKCLVPGAIAYWDCTQLSPDGQTLYDQSGNGYHGTLGSTPGVDTNDPVPGPTGLTFDGDDYVALPLIPSIGAAQVVFYIAAPVTAASDPQYVLGVSVPGPSDFGGIVLGSITGGLADEIVTVVQTGGTAARSAWCSASGSVAAGWHVLTAAWSGAQYDIILDGAALPITNTGTPTILTPTAAPYLGRAYSTFGYYLTGIIAAARLYPSGLSAAQAAQNRAYWRAWGRPKGIIL